MMNMRTIGHFEGSNTISSAAFGYLFSRSSSHLRHILHLLSANFVLIKSQQQRRILGFSSCFATRKSCLLFHLLLADRCK